MRAARVVVAALLVVGVTGCPRRLPRPIDATVESVIASLEARRGAVDSLRARARIKNGVAGLWSKQMILVRRPDGVRIDVLVPYGIALALGVDGGRLWAFPPSRGVRFEGPADAATLGRLLGAPVEARDLIDVLLGVPPARQPNAAPTLNLERDGTYRLVVPHAQGVETIWLTGDALIPVRVEERMRDTVMLRVVFGRHEDGFPRELTLAAPARGAEARLVFDQVEPNATIDPVLFHPPAATDVRPLEALAG